MSIGSEVVSGVTLTTYTITEGNNTTVTYYDTSSGVSEDVGQKVTNGTTGESSSSIMLKQSDGSFIQTETYLEKTGASEETRTYNYDYNSTFTGGTEVLGGVTYKVNSDYSLASAQADVTGSAFTEVTDTTGIAAGAIASSGKIYKKENDYGNNDKEITYFDKDGAITGYEYSYNDGTFSGSSFENADREYVGDKFSDGLFTFTNFSSTNSDGSYVETGSYEEKAANGTVLTSRSFTFTYDSAGDLKSGEETVDGETTTYGANWAVEGKKVDTSNLTTADAPSDIPTSFAVDGKTYTSTETLPWGDKETTYYNASGAELGNSYTSEYTYDGVTSKGVNFNNVNGEWIGSTYTDGTWSSRMFITDNGNGTRTEKGFESDGSGWSRDWNFIFSDTDGSLVSGAETINGITTTFGANWEETGRSADTSSLTKLNSDLAVDFQTQLDALPDSFVLTEASDSSEYALYKAITNPWGDETTYFNASGEIIGYAFSWSDNWGSGTSYNDADWGYLGDTFTDKSSGYTHTRFETKNSDGTITETGSEMDGSTVIRSWTFKFDSNYNLIEGVELRDGVTTNFGANWEFKGESKDISGLTELSDLDAIVSGTIKLSDLYDFTATVDGASVTKGFSESKDKSYGDGQEITYYNAAGEIIGRVDEFGFEDSTFKSEGKAYFDGNWNWIGDKFTDTFDGQTFSRSFFEFDTADGGRREVGSEGDGNWSRSWEYIFGADGKLVSGTENDNGIEITYGADWAVSSRKADTSGLDTLSVQAALDELPDAFVLTANGSEYALYSEQTYGANDKERTFFDADGVILGYANSWKDPYWGGEGTNYNDADWNYLGDVFSDGTFKTVRTETQNSDGTRTEIGTEYTNSGTTDSPVWEEARSWNFKFDDNWNLVEGTETREDGVTVQFGANWIIKGETFDTSKLAGNELDPTTKIVSKDDYALLDASKELTYADLFDFTTTVNGQEVTTAYAMTEEFTWGGSETVYYNASGDIVGRSHANDMFLRQEDTLPKFKFFRMETKEEGGYIDFFGVGVDHLDAFSGKAIMIPLGAKVGGRVDNPADIPTTVAALDAMIDDFSQSQISSDAAYGPEKSNWLATRNGADTVDGVVSLSTLGFVVSNISAEAPTIESIVDIDVISGDDLQYYYSWENDDAIFSNVNDTTEVTVDTAKIIETYSAYLTANPPQNIQFMGPEHEFIASVDKSFDELHYRFEKDDPNSDGIVETGVDVNPYSVRSWEFDLDENFNFLGGTETEDGITREINQFGQTTSQTIDASALDKLTTQATLDDLPSSFVLKDENDVEYANYKSEKYPGGEETFYFTDSGTILGRSTSWSDPYWGGSGIDYFDASDQFIGGTFSDGTFTSVRFETTDASSGNRTETGSETRDGTVEREWTFEFDSNFNLISGTETRSDGTTTTYGANWEILGESVSLSSLTALTANDFNAEIVKFDASAADVASGLVKLSDVYDFSVTGSSTLSGYYKKDDFDWSDGYEITYYDGAGKTLGRKIVDIFVDQGGIAGQAGGVTANQGGSSGSSATTFVVTQVDGKFLIDGVSQKELTLDEGKTYKFDLSSTTLSTHPFKLGAGGSEYTNGTDGSTIVTSGTQATSGAYLEVTLSPSAPSALNYYCSAHSGMGAAISTNDAQINVQYVDKDWNWIGDSFDDGNFSRSFIKVSKDDGSKVEISVDGNRSSLYNFNDKDVFQGGTEIEGGLTYTITSDWVREGGKMDTSALNALKVTGSVLDGVPSSLTFDDSGTETAYRDLTYEDTNYGGKEYTYFDSTGAKLGHSFEFTDSWSGEKVTDFNDKDYNWLGNVRVKTGEYKNVYSRSEDQTAGTSTEVNARYTWDSGNSAWVESESSTYIFNLNNGNLIEGTETRGGITTEYGANWAVEKSSANVSALTEISATDLAEHLGNSNVALGDIYNFTATVNGSEVTKGYKSEQSFTDPYGGGANVDTTYYNAAGEEIGKSNSYSGSYGSGANFQDVDYNHLGDYNQQGTWSNSFFKIPTTDSSGNVTGKTEYRVEKDTGSNGFTREFVEVFDANGNFVSGTETENGLTKDITVDSNGFRVVSAAALDQSDLAALAVTDATVLAEIPTSFVFDVSGTDTAYVKLTRDDSGGSQMTGGGKEYTYFNAQGTEIGKAFEFQNWDGAKVTDFNTVDYHFLGSVRVKTDDYKEIRFEETKDVSGTQRFVETFTEYTWDISASPAAWKVTRSEESIYTDEPYEGGTLVSRVEERDGHKFTFDDTGAMIGSVFIGNIDDVSNLSNPALLSALPSQWGALGTIKATFETVPGADTTLWNVSDYYTFYVKPDGAENAEIVGYANLNANYEDDTKPGDGYSETSMTFIDKDEVTEIGGASENEFFQTAYFYTPGANNTYTYTDKTITFGPNGTIEDQSKTTSNYKDATGEISGGTYNGGSYTSMGFTEFYDANGDVTATNYAPTSEINNIAPSSTPSRGILPEEDELTLETYAGNVTESNDGSTSAVTGTIETDDADGETPSLTLMGGDTSGNEQTLDGQFGDLVLNDDGTYEYELFNDSRLDGLNDGDIETDGFVVEVKDAYHTTYQMLDFEILGKDDVVANRPGVGFDIAVDGGGPVQVGSNLIAVTSSLQDPDGLPSQGLDFYWLAEGASGRDEVLFNGPEYTVKSSDAGKTIYGTVDYTDEAGNDESVASIAKLSVSGTYDNVAPVVTAFTASIGDGTYGAGTNILLKATISEPVQGNNSITVTLNNGATVPLSAPANGGNILEGTYKVDARDGNSSDLTVVSYTLGRILDDAENDMVSTDLPAGNNLGDNSNIVIDTSGGSGSDTPFSIDLAGTNDLSFNAMNFSAQTEMAVKGDATDGYYLEANKLTVKDTIVRDNANNMASANPFSLSVNIDGVANFSAPKTEDITIIVRDDNSGGRADTKDAGEREVSATFKVRAEGDGSDATVTALTGTANAVFTKSDGSTVAVNLNNVNEDVINITSDALNSPSSLNLKVANLLDSIDQYVDVNMLSQVGDYYYEITGLNNLLNEISDSRSLPIEKVTGTISVVKDPENPFSINLSGSNDITFNAMNWTAQADMSLKGSVSDGFYLNASELTVDSTIVRENVNGINSANPFGLSVNLDAIAKFTTPKNEEIKITVRDVSDGGRDGFLDAGEREVSTTIKVRAEGNGTDATITALTGNTNTVLTKSDGSTVSVTLNNVAQDVVNLTSGTNNSPSSLNFKIAELLEDIDAYVDVNMLSQVGKYEYIISGLGNLLNEPDARGDIRSIDKFVGKINVVNDQAVNPDISGINLSFDDDGSAGGTVSSYNLDLTTKNHSGDDYISVALKSGDTITAQQVNDLDTPGLNFAPNITIDLDSAIDTGASSINQDVRIEIVEIDSLNSSSNYLSTHQNGNRKVQLDFELNRKGDGSEETWSSIPGDQMAVKVWNTDNSASPKYTSNITNNDVDTFIAPVNLNGETGNSLDIKLQSLLDKVNDITSTPTAQAGDMYALTVSFIDDSNQSDIILSGEFTLT